MTDPALTRLAPDPVQAAILAELRAIRGLLEIFAAPRKPDANERPGRLLQALAVVLGDFDDLPFETPEVFELAQNAHDLDLALTECGTRTPAALGALFRSIRGRCIDGLRIERDGRAWRLVRCCT